MATVFTHAFVAASLGKATYPKKMPWRFWALAIFCSTAPDLDVGLHYYGVEYGDPWGHRGMTHSLFFAAIMSLVLVTVILYKQARPLSHKWLGLVTFFFLLTASHGFLDAFTNGGLGIAFFAPFDNTRYFMPWRPIEVSPLGIRYIFTSYFARVLLSELLFICLPTVVFCGLVYLVRRSRKAMNGPVH